MQVLPRSPESNLTKSEIKVFNILSDLNGDLFDSGIVLSSLNLSSQEKRRWGEIDFIIVFKKGLLVIEVKGGDISCTDGVWEYADSLGRKIHKNISPLVQAKEGYFYLVEKILKPRFGKDFIERVTSGFCVYFPLTSIDSVIDLLSGPEMPRALVACREDLGSTSALIDFMEGVLDFWKKKKVGLGGEWTSDEIKEIVKFLRPSFDRVAPLSIWLKNIRDEQYALTEDQYKALDYFELAPRVVISAGAGCGKTFIAAECFRREKDAIFVTGSHRLAGHLRSSDLGDGSKIYSFRELKNLPSISKKFNTLIVDEGQLITNSDAIELLDAALIGGIQSGRWRWFCDINNQIYKEEFLFQESAQERLINLAGGFEVQLKQNCRNTPQIVKTVEFLTGHRVGETKVNGVGPDVIWGHGDNVEDLVSETSGAVRKWLSAGENIFPSQIIFLTPKSIQESYITKVCNALRIPFEEWRPGWDFSFGKKFGFSTIEDFRGLEAPFIVLCDLDESIFNIEKVIYLGMTRANFGLFVGCSNNLKEILVNRYLSKDQQ
jgi:hypothetical protein